MRLYLSILFIGGLILGGLFVLLGGPLQFQKLEIAGVSGALAAELEELLIQEAQTWPGARFLGYRNLLIWPDGELRSQNPRLSGGLVQKDILGKTIKITLPEKKRSLIWCGERCYWLDNSGYSIEEAPAAEGTLVPIVISKSSGAVPLGYSVLPAQLFDNLLEIISILEFSGLSGQDLVVDVAAKELVAKRDGSATLYFNLTNDPESAAAPLKRLMKSPGLNKMSYADFRIENRVYYR